MRQHAQKFTLILLALLVLLVYRSNQTKPVTTPTNTAVVHSGGLPLSLIRYGLVLSTAQDGRGAWTGFMLTDRDRPEIMTTFLAKFGEGLADGMSYRDIAPADNSQWWWTLGRNRQTQVPVIATIHAKPGETSVRTSDLVPGDIESFAPIADGTACALALKKDGFWQVSIAQKHGGDVERFILREIGKQALASSPTLPLIAVPMQNSDHLMLFTRQPAALHILIAVNGRVAGHNVLPLDLDPQAASLFYVADSQGGRYHILLAGRRDGFDVVTDLTCKETGLEGNERGRFEQDIAAPQGVERVLARIREGQLNGMALAYRGVPALRVIHANPEQRAQTMSTIFLPPGDLQSGQASLGTPVTISGGPYWLAAPFTSLMPDGTTKSALMLVDQFGRHRLVEKAGLTTALTVVDQCLLWVLRGGPDGDRLIAVRSTDLAESAPLPLLTRMDGPQTTDRIISEAEGNKRVY